MFNDDNDEEGSIWGLGGLFWASVGSREICFTFLA